MRNTKASIRWSDKTPQYPGRTFVNICERYDVELLMTPLKLISSNFLDIRRSSLDQMSSHDISIAPPKPWTGEPRELYIEVK